jgi:hypothetical protein
VESTLQFFNVSGYERKGAPHEEVPKSHLKQVQTTTRRLLHTHVGKGT